MEVTFVIERIFRQQIGQRYSKTPLPFPALIKRPKHDGAYQPRPTVEVKTYASPTSIHVVVIGQSFDFTGFEAI